MDDFGAAKIAQLRQVAAALRTALMAGANAYANGKTDANGKALVRPIVDRHYTAGNQTRYGWPPLSRDYFRAKQRSLVGKQSGGVFHPGGEMRGSKLDKAAEFQSSTGTMSGIGAGTNKPMLVNSGALRHAVTSVRHTIAMRGDMAVISFRGLPDYAIHLENGTGSMPARSPVQPGAADRQEVLAVMRRHMDAALATAGPVANSTPLPLAGARRA